MSGKIKSKDLSYDSSLPPFLQRLHDKNAGRGDTDRHERPVARAMRAKDPNEDDGPTMVDESGETVSKEEYEKLTKADAELAAEGAEGGVRGGSVGGTVTGAVEGDGKPEGSGALLERQESKMTDGLGTKKRKAAKVIGEEDGDDDRKAETNVKNGDEKKASEKKTTKPKKKAKAIKLAFDDGEEG